MLFCALAVGCKNQNQREQLIAPSPPPTFTGPAYLHGTVGSLASVRGYEPILVGGFGLVVNLEGTGDNGAPAFIRQWILNEMSRKGLGSARLGTQELTPGRVLASPNTAVVAIEGLIPPAAIRGSTFDLLVTALPQTQTTSLANGTLWSADLALGGADTTLRFGRKLAEAKGPIYINPFAVDALSQKQKLEHNRTAIILSGGIVTQDRKLQLVLNQPSWERSRAITDRINERFPADPDENLATAIAQTDVLIDLHVPRRYQRSPERLLALVSDLFIQRGPEFEPQKAQQLAETLLAEPATASNIILAWQSLGKTTLPVLRQYYRAGQLHMQLASLEAGTKLGDGAALEPLVALSKHQDAAIRKHVATLLGAVPGNLFASRTLYDLVDDGDRAVRIAAYEALANNEDPRINRVLFGRPDEEGRLERSDYKFALDLVPAKKPLVVINQARLPRMAIFNPNLALHTPLMARLWDNHLMLRGPSPDAELDVYYQEEGRADGKTFQIKPFLANLLFLLAHHSTVENPTEGLDLSYSQVANAVYLLHEQGVLQCDLELKISPLAQAIAHYKETQQPELRPETGSTGAPGIPGSTPGATAPGPALAPAPGPAGKGPQAGAEGATAIPEGAPAGR